MKNLKKAVVIAMTGATLSMVNTHASAQVLMTDSGAVAGAQSWNGNNNGYLGWAHTVDWFTFKATNAGTINVKMTGSASAVQPAFTVWNLGAADQAWGNGHTFSQIKDETIGSANASFVGFANNYGADEHFGHGPDDLKHGGDAALAGTTALFGTDGNGNKFAELIFSNFTADTWYAIAAGGSGGGNGVYSISANLTAVPLPGAVWLFGSAMAGLIGFGRRKAITS